MNGAREGPPGVSPSAPGPPGAAGLPPVPGLVPGGRRRRRLRGHRERLRAPLVVEAHGRAHVGVVRAAGAGVGELDREAVGAPGAAGERVERHALEPAELAVEDLARPGRPGADVLDEEREDVRQPAAVRAGLVVDRRAREHEQARRLAGVAERERARRRLARHEPVRRDDRRVGGAVGERERAARGGELLHLGGPLPGEGARGEHDDDGQRGGEDRGEALHGPAPLPSQIVTGTS